MTSRDVAKLAGVSVATVSRVYANSNVVTDSTAKKVLDAASQLGYIPNTVARSLKSNSSKTIGLVITNIFNPVFYQVASGGLSGLCQAKSQKQPQGPDYGH